jgi:dienelactone hydrolase
MIENNIEYEVAGHGYAGVLVRGPSAVRGGILVLHGGSGPTGHERGVAGRLAELGYVALVPDLFGERFADRERGMAVIGQLVATPGILRDRVNAAMRKLVVELGERVPVGAVGHCFGGLASLELARSGADVRAVVSLHGGLSTREPARRGDIRARVLACTGADDPFCTPEHRAAFEAEMTAAGADWQHHVYGGTLHGFSVADAAARPGVAHHEASERRSWRAMVDLFDEVMPACPPN